MLPEPNQNERRQDPWWILILTGLLLLAGCRETAMAPPPVHLPVRLVWAGHQCGGPAPGASAYWIDGSADLQRKVLSRPAVQAALAGGSMDWAREGLLWVRMGRKPTGGFGLDPASSEAVVAQGIARVTVQWREPPPGAFVTQAITSPCLLLQLPRNDFHQVEVRDPSGRVRARAEVPPAP